MWNLFILKITMQPDYLPIVKQISIIVIPFIILVILFTLLYFTFNWLKVLYIKLSNKEKYNNMLIADSKKYAEKNLLSKDDKYFAFAYKTLNRFFWHYISEYIITSSILVFLLLLMILMYFWNWISMMKDLNM